MKERMFAVLWPAFLAAGVLEMLVFALVDPEDVLIAGQHVSGSNLAVYTLAFLLFWAVTSASSAMTCLLGAHGTAHDVESP